MHAICDGLNDYSYEDTLFSKHMVYLKENKDNFDKSVELNKTMSVMANMIEHFGLHVNTGDEYWKVLHLFLEVILDKSNRATTWNSDRVRIISGALFMLSKIWIRWPSILKTNAILLNFFWYFTSQDSFNSWDKVAILEIYHEFLQSFTTSESSQLNFGEFIDWLKTDMAKYWNILCSTSKQLRVSGFRVLKQWYLLGMVPHLQAWELFLVCLNDNVTEVDSIRGSKVWDESLSILTDICRKDAQVLFKLNLTSVR